MGFEGFEGGEGFEVGESFEGFEGYYSHSHYIVHDVQQHDAFQFEQSISGCLELDPAWHHAVQSLLSLPSELNAQLVSDPWNLAVFVPL